MAAVITITAITITVTTIMAIIITAGIITAITIMATTTTTIAVTVSTFTNEEKPADGVGRLTTWAGSPSIHAPLAFGSRTSGE